MGLVTTGPAATVSAATVFAAFRSVGKDPSARLTSNWICRYGIGGDCNGSHVAMAHDGFGRVDNGRDDSVVLTMAHAAMDLYSQAIHSMFEIIAAPTLNLPRSRLTSRSGKSFCLKAAGFAASGSVVIGLAATRWVREMRHARTQMALTEGLDCYALPRLALPPWDW